MSLQKPSLRAERVHRSNRCLTFVSLLSCLTMMPTISWSQPARESDAATAKVAKPDAANGQKWALLIGVDQYVDRRLGSLQYCGADVQSLRDVLVRQGGFPADQVIVLHDKQTEAIRQPLRLSIEQSLKALLAQAGPKDLVLISFSGHGIQVGETAYLCPTEADVDKPEATMISVSAMYDKLSKECHAAQKIVFIDACRRPVASGQKAPALELTKGFSDRLREVPEGLLILSSCRAGQLSYEEKEFGHGVFAHFLLDGLTGKADARGPNLRGNGDGRIDVDELFNYASTQTGKYVMNKFVEAQTPELYGVRRGPIDLFAALPDVREIIDKAALAIRFLQDTKDDSSRSEAIKQITQTQVKLGDLNSALATARSISDDIAMAQALRPVVESQLEKGDISAATATCRLIRNEDWRAGTLCDIAVKQADVGDFSAALKTIASIGKSESYSIQWSTHRALMVIAVMQANAGDKQAAAATLKMAIKIWDSATFELGKWVHIGEIAVAYAEIGDFASAISVARSNTSESHKLSALNDISVIQAKSGNAQAARTTLEESLRVARANGNYIALKDAAVAQATIGDVKAARSTFDNALKLALADKPNSDFDSQNKPHVLVLFAEAAVEMGDQAAAIEVFNAAVDTARTIKDPHQNGAALEWIARAQIKAGEFPSAIKTVRAVSGDMERAHALAEIATLETGDANRIEKAAIIREALRLFGTNDDRRRGQGAWSLLKVALAQVQLGLGAEAAATLRGVFQRLADSGQNSSLRYMHKEIMDYCKGQVASGNFAFVRDLADELTDAQSQGRFSLYLGLAEAILDQRTPAITKK